MIFLCQLSSAKDKFDARFFISYLALPNGALSTLATSWASVCNTWTAIQLRMILNPILDGGGFHPPTTFYHLPLANYANYG